MDINKLRHSTAHILAHAVKNLFPQIKLGIGPTTEDGFYYDFDRKEPFTQKDLKKIEREMNKLIKEHHTFKKIKLTSKQLKDFLKKEPYKKQLYNDLKKAKAPITFYQNGKFIDLCAGPHIKNSKEIQAFKLLKVAGAYWKGESKNKQLQRIYGTAFPTEEQLNKHLKLLEEAEERDHIKLGKQLGLFIVHPAIGKGLPLFTPKGALIKRLLQRWIEDEETKRGYQFTDTPVLAKTDLYKISGHLEHYRDKMFIFKTDEKEEVALRPMTCPYQFLIYKSKQRSYKDLPIKYAETSQLFRKELSGELHGLIRIWQFTLADAHIFCKQDQVEEEFVKVLNFIEYIMKTLGLTDYWYRFSRWDPKDKGKYINNPKAWKKSEAMMKKILNKLKIRYEEVKGDAAFYGPKLDFQMKNVWGKEDTMFTVQIDFALPERFNLTYMDKNDKKERPMVIHRSSIGCYERTIAMLIEHYAGRFPLWLAPVQVKLVTITDRNVKYAKQIEKLLKENNIRVELDDRTETLNKKVREAQLNDKSNYIVTIGDKEVKNKTLAVRSRNNKVKFGIKPKTFLKELQIEIETKKC